MNTTEKRQEKPTQQAENMQNQGEEDFSGGGQEATEEDLKVERQEETVTTDITTAEEMEEVPENIESGQQNTAQKILLRKVNDDPGLFLKRKFEREVKTKNLKPKEGANKW